MHIKTFASWVSYININTAISIDHIFYVPHCGCTKRPFYEQHISELTSTLIYLPFNNHTRFFLSLISCLPSLFSTPAVNPKELLQPIRKLNLLYPSLTNFIRYDVNIAYLIVGQNSSLPRVLSLVASTNSRRPNTVVVWVRQSVGHSVSGDAHHQLIFRDTNIQPVVYGPFLESSRYIIVKVICQASETVAHKKEKKQRNCVIKINSQNGQITWYSWDFSPVFGSSLWG